MISIIKEEYYRCRRNPDEKDYEKKIIFTFDEMRDHIDFHTSGEQDSFDMLINYLMDKTKDNNWIKYEIHDDEEGFLFKLQDGKKYNDN